MEGTIDRRTARLSDAWATRPARPREGRMIAGVAAALGERYAVDPVLIRVAFATAAFFGPGIPLYLVGCAVLPDAGSTGSGRSRTVLSTVLLVGAALLVAGMLFGDAGGWVAPLLVSLVLLALLHATRGGPPPAADGDATRAVSAPPGQAATTAPIVASAPAATAAQTATAGTAGTAGTAATHTDTAPTDPSPAEAVGQESGTPAAESPTEATASGPTTPGSTASDGPESAGRPAPVVAPADAAPLEPPRATPPSWDPLGAAPFAWDLPEPAPENEPEPARASRLTPVTLAVALLASGAAGAASLAAPTVVTPVMVPATALAVLGIGLVVGAFRHAGRWLIPFALVLAVTTWMVAMLPWSDLRGGVGTIADAPTTPAAVAPEYERGVGDVALDLSGLDLSTPPGAAETTVRTTARVGVGSIAVTVPPDADIVIRGSSGLGDVTVAGQSRSGSSAELEVVDNGPDGPGGGRIELDAQAALGSVTVSRG